MGVTQYWCNVWATKLPMHKVNLRNGSRYLFNCVYGMYSMCSASVWPPVCFSSAYFSWVYDTYQDEKSSEARFSKLTLSISASWFPSRTCPPLPWWHTTQNKKTSALKLRQFSGCVCIYLCHCLWQSAKIHYRFRFCGVAAEMHGSITTGTPLKTGLDIHVLSLCYHFDTVVRIVFLCR